MAGWREGGRAGRPDEWVVGWWAMTTRVVVLTRVRTKVERLGVLERVVAITNERVVQLDKKAQLAVHLFEHEVEQG